MFIKILVREISARAYREWGVFQALVLVLEHHDRRKETSSSDWSDVFHQAARHKESYVI